MSATPCRRCSDCDGNHHWIDSDMATEDGPWFVCKHCDATADECESCDGSGEDPNVPMTPCAACKGYGAKQRADAISRRSPLQSAACAKTCSTARPRSDGGGDEDA